MTDDTEDLAAALAAMDRNAREGESIQRVLFRMALVNAYRAGRLVVDEGWRLIETAPRDGSSMLVAFQSDDGEWFVVSDEWSLLWDHLAYCTEATHWRPLPAPPKGEDE